MVIGGFRRSRYHFDMITLDWGKTLSDGVTEKAKILYIGHVRSIYHVTESYCRFYADKRYWNEIYLFRESTCGAGIW